MTKWIAMLAAVLLAVGGVAGAQTFGDGTHLVGMEIEPGIYRASGDGLRCTWYRLSGLSGGARDWLAWDSGPKPTVEILASDTAFRTNDCGTWQLIAAPGELSGDKLWDMCAPIAEIRYDQIAEIVYTALASLAYAMLETVGEDTTEEIVNVARRMAYAMPADQMEIISFSLELFDGAFRPPPGSRSPPARTPPRLQRVPAPLPPAAPGRP